MSNANLGWMFYKDYFKGIDYNNLDTPNNENIIKEKVNNIISNPVTVQSNEPLGNVHFKATTTYPGLILGSGNAHELPSIEGQAILGFSFDYTSGLPIIAGSSIKGVLRSAFEHSEYIKELLNNKELDIKKLETEIFDNGDIFFDAQLISHGNILADDYLAPHGDDPLKNPKPLRFIKVAPNVTFMFDFELSDGLVSKTEKSKLFQNILEDLGVGAKTNVGYGKFENFSPFKTKEEIEQEQLAQQRKKEQDEQKRLADLEKLKEQKEQKAQDGLNALLKSKTFADGLKILKDSFTTAKPKLTSEQIDIVKQFANKFRNKATPKEFKALKKYGVT